MKTKKILNLFICILSLCMLMGFTSNAAYTPTAKDLKTVKSNMIKYFKYMKQYDIKKMGKLQKGKLGYTYWASGKYKTLSKKYIKKYFKYSIKSITADGSFVTANTIVKLPSYYEQAYDACDDLEEYVYAHPRTTAKQAAKYLEKRIEKRIKKAKPDIITYDVTYVFQKVNKSWKIKEYICNDDELDYYYDYALTMDIYTAMDDWEQDDDYDDSDYYY